MAGLRVAVRADASAVRGTGHVARCLTLAAAVKTRGGAVTFIGRSLPPVVVSAIAGQGHDWVQVPGTADQDNGPVHGVWPQARQVADARGTGDLLRGAAWDWLVVDHYNLDRTWEDAVAGVAGRLLVVDDLADRPHRADVLVDQNLPVDRLRYAGLAPPGCRLLLGPGFALVRGEFLAVRERQRLRDGQIGHVLVGFGGGDADALSMVAIDACVQAGLGEGQVDVVVGGLSPGAAQVEAACQRVGYTFHRQTPGMAALMERADLMIGATGTSSWERCVVGLPALAVATARNQERVAAGLAAAGAIVTVPPGVAQRPGVMGAVLHDLRRDPARVRRMSASARQLVDGLGAGRVYDVMEGIES